MSKHINNGLHMKTDGVNKDGRITRLPTDNKVIKNAGEVSYKKNKVPIIGDLCQTIFKKLT